VAFTGRLLSFDVCRNATPCWAANPCAACCSWIRPSSAAGGQQPQRGQTRLACRLRRPAAPSAANANTNGPARDEVMAHSAAKKSLRPMGRPGAARRTPPCNPRRWQNDKGNDAAVQCHLSFDRVENRHLQHLPDIMDAPNASPRNAPLPSLADCSRSRSKQVGMALTKVTQGRITDGGRRSRWKSQ
jgi:hypothetical protein